MLNHNLEAAIVVLYCHLSVLSLTNQYSWETIKRNFIPVIFEKGLMHIHLNRP